MSRPTGKPPVQPANRINRRLNRPTGKPPVEPANRETSGSTGQPGNRRLNRRFPGCPVQPANRINRRLNRPTGKPPVEPANRETSGSTGQPPLGSEVVLRTTFPTHDNFQCHTRASQLSHARVSSKSALQKSESCFVGTRVSVVRAKSFAPLQSHNKSRYLHFSWQAYFL